MLIDEQLLAAIRRRDAELGENIPSHWVAQWDRRDLLRMLDAAFQRIYELEEWEA